MVERTPSGPNGDPWALGESSTGEPYPMWLCRTIRVGRSVSARKVCNARATDDRSLTSATVVTFQPYARNRAATSSVKVRSVCPSIVTRLES